MTTQIQLKQLLKPLMDEDPSLISFSRFLVVTPIRHHISALLLDRTRSEQYFRVRVWPSFLALSAERDEPLTGWARYSWPYDNYWSIDEPEYPLNRRMQLKYSLIPELKLLNDFARFESQQREYFDDASGGYVETQAFLAIAFGDFKEAAEWMAKDWRHEPRKLINSHIPGLGDRLAEQGDNLSMEDKRKLIAVLHEREAAAIHALKLEKYWRPTPFPAEENGLV